MKQTMQKMYDPTINETFYYCVLENGLPVYILPKEGFHQKYAIFTTHYGSVDNRFQMPGEKDILVVPDGIAHFLEHKMFELEGGNVFDQFAALGANVNAFTSYNTTSYLFDTVENFPEALELLLDFVQSIYLTDETVEKEKGIIEQEILMYDDDPDWIGHLHLLQGLFHKHPTRVDIAGTVESIYEIDRTLLEKCYRAFYHPSNMVLFLQGDFDPKEIIDQVDMNQARKGFNRQSPIMRFSPDEPNTILKQWVEVNMPVSRPIYNLGFKEQKLGLKGDQLLKQDLISSMLLEILVGKGSELYQELYAEGLIDDSFSVSFSGEADYGMTVLGGYTNNPNRLHEALQTGLLKKVGNIKKEELERVRKRMIGDYITSFDSMKATAQNFVGYYFKDMNLFSELKLLNEITLEELEQRFTEQFDYQYHAVSVVYPEQG